LPDQLDALTQGELRSLQEHRRLQHEWEHEQAAFSGYCAGLAFALAWNGKLEGFDQFFQKPTTPAEKAQTSEEYVARYNSWT
jgi:hypothetical protein